MHNIHAHNMLCNIRTHRTDIHMPMYTQHDIPTSMYTTHVHSVDTKMNTHECIITHL